MVVHGREFADLYYPVSPYSRAPYHQPPQLAWSLIQNPSTDGLTKLLRTMGGKPITYVESPLRSQGPARRASHALRRLPRADRRREGRHDDAAHVRIHRGARRRVQVPQLHQPAVMRRRAREPSLASRGRCGDRWLAASRDDAGLCREGAAALASRARPTSSAQVRPFRIRSIAPGSPSSSGARECGSTTSPSARPKACDSSSAARPTSRRRTSRPSLARRGARDGARAP